MIEGTRAGVMDKGGGRVLKDGMFDLKGKQEQMRDEVRRT